MILLINLCCTILIYNQKSSNHFWGKKMRYQLNSGYYPINQQLKAFIQKISTKCTNISFQSSWIQLFLQLFKDKLHFFYFIQLCQECQHEEVRNSQDIVFTSQLGEKIDYQSRNSQFSNMTMQVQMNYPKIDNNTQQLSSLRNQIFILMDRQLNCFKQEGKNNPNLIKQDNKMSYLQWSQIIQSLIIENPFLSEGDIYSQLQKFDSQQAPKPNMIIKILLMKDYHRIKLGKVPIERNSMRNIQNRYKFGFKLYNILKNEGIIHYFDHYQLDTNFLHEYKWIKTDDQPFNKRQGQCISLYISLCNQGRLFYEIKQQDNDKNQCLAQFISNFIGQAKKENNYQEFIVAGENIRIDNTLKKLCREKELKLLQLPPLSPQCSPLHYIYLDLKTAIRQKGSNLKNLSQLKENLEIFCRNIRPQEYCAHIESSIVDVLMKKMS